MQLAEFEEKEFETPLYSELTTSRERITPGQVLEKYIGIDSAMFVDNDEFWNLIGYKSDLRGVILRDHKIRRLQINPNELPDFKHNLFIQAKRPDYLIGPHPKAKLMGIKNDYYRFKIVEHQQKALYKLHCTLDKSKALVLYASPCFDTKDELYKLQSKGEIIQNTNFVRIPSLNHHSQWIYEYPGFQGVGCSEPKFIHDKGLAEILNQDVRFVKNEGTKVLQKNFENVYESVKEVVRFHENIFLDKEIRRIDRVVDDYYGDNSKFIKYYLVSQCYFHLNRIFWLLQ